MEEWFWIINSSEGPKKAIENLRLARLQDDNQTQGLLKRKQEF
jgi:hypothetical protein